MYLYHGHEPSRASFQTMRGNYLQCNYMYVLVEIMRCKESWFLLPVFNSAVLFALIYSYETPLINGQKERIWLKLASLRRLEGLASQPLKAHYCSNKRIDPLV